MAVGAAAVARAAAVAAAGDQAETDKVVIVARVADPPRATRQHPVRRRRPHNRVRQPAARRVDARVVISQPATIHSDAVGAAIRLTVGINSDVAVRAAARAERTAVADSDEAVGAEAEAVAIKRLCSIVSKACRPTNRNSSSIG